jgi:hypothetical protein
MVPIVATIHPVGAVSRAPDGRAHRGLVGQIDREESASADLTSDYPVYPVVETLAG